MTFTAEIRKVQARKTASLDVEYEVILRSQDVQLLSLGALSADQTVLVTVKPVGG